MNKNGRPETPMDEEKFKAVCARWHAGDITAVQAAEEMKFTRCKFYRRAAARGLSKPKA